MSNLSNTAIEQIYRSESTDPALLLLTLMFPNNNTFYYVNNTEDITSNGQVFTAFPFNFTLPSDDPETQPNLSIILDNVGLELIDDFSSNTDSINAKVELVFASNPDFVEVTIENLIVKTIGYNKYQITINLGYEDIFNTSIPSNTYNAKDFPGLFGV